VRFSASAILAPKALTFDFKRNAFRACEENIMKRFAWILVLGTGLAGPSFAQETSNQPPDWASRVHMYTPNHYAPQPVDRTQNPDYQLGSNRG
jgi:hypothetical protein